MRVLVISSDVQPPPSQAAFIQKAPVARLILLGDPRIVLWKPGEFIISISDFTLR